MELYDDESRTKIFCRTAMLQLASDAGSLLPPLYQCSKFRVEDSKHDAIGKQLGVIARAAKTPALTLFVPWLSCFSDPGLPHCQNDKVELVATSCLKLG